MVLHACSGASASTWRAWRSSRSVRLLCGLAPTLGMLILFRDPAGRGRRRAAAGVAGHPGGELPAEEARHGDGGLRHGRGGGAHHRTDAGRLDHRQLQLALDLPDQYSGRHAVAAAHLADHLRSALPGAQDAARRPADRLHRAGAADQRAWAFSRSCWTKDSGATGCPRT